MVTFPKITSVFLFFLHVQHEQQQILISLFVALQVKLQEAIEYDDLQGDSGRKTISLNLKKSDR